MKARPYLLEETNWQTVKSTDYQVAVVTWGATEAHNYHLPYGTDNYEAKYVATEAARLAWDQGAKVIVLPHIPYGVNTGQLDIKLCMNMNPSTQYAVLKDIVDVLVRHHIHKLVILNGHWEKGKIYLKEVTEKISEFLVELERTKLADLYE